MAAYFWKDEGDRGLVTRLAVDEMEEWLPCFAAPDVFGDDARGGRCAGFRRDMRRDRDLRMRPVGVFGGQRLSPENVERGMAELTAVERRKERFVVDQGAAAGVHDDSAPRKERKRIGVQRVLGCGRVGQQKDDDIGLPKRVVEAVRSMRRCDTVD